MPTFSVFEFAVSLDITVAYRDVDVCQVGETEDASDELTTSSVGLDQAWDTYQVADRLYTAEPRSHSVLLSFVFK